jgi:hypothetical protein
MLTTGHAGSGKGRTSFRLFSLLLATAACLLCLNIPVFTVLVIRDTETNQAVWSNRIADGAAFAIRWTHSIHRTPVTEYYRIRGDQLVLTEMTFKDYGIGMNNELAPGEHLLVENGQFHVINMNRVFPALHLFIGQVRANHTLLFAGKEIPLGSVDKPGAAVTIRVEKQNILDQIGGY